MADMTHIPNPGELLDKTAYQAEKEVTNAPPTATAQLA